jgi:hypothetical protein
MAGLIAALFGGRSRPQVDANPVPGIGGVNTGPGPAGQTGFPGSTSSTRTFRGHNPRQIGLRADRNSGWDGQLGTQVQERQVSYRGDVPGAAVANPRATPSAFTRQPILTQRMQETPATFYGGPLLRTGPGNNTAGGQPGRRAAAAGGHAQRDTTTPWVQAQPVIGVNTPGSANVRNQIAQRYKNRPGQSHTYKSAARADQAPVNLGGQATDGNVKPDLATTEVTVQNRFVFPGGGNQTWSVLREMPYGGRGNGARGADLNGQRFYASGQRDQFWNAGQGDFGIARARGGDHKRPVSFAMPAPWTANFYDTTADVDAGNTPQAPTQVYVSPSAGRASNSTGRRS